MKKTLIIVLVLVLSLGMATYAFADDTAPATQPFKTAVAKIKDLPQLVLNDEQKAQMTSMMNQMLQLRKEIIQSNVDNGTITEEQATFMQERLDKRMESVKSGDFKPGMGDRGRRGGPHRFQQQQPQTNNQ